MYMKLSEASLRQNSLFYNTFTKKRVRVLCSAWTFRITFEFPFELFLGSLWNWLSMKASGKGSWRVTSHRRCTWGQNTYIYIINNWFSAECHGGCNTWSFDFVSLPPRPLTAWPSLCFKAPDEHHLQTAGEGLGDAVPTEIFSSREPASIAGCRVGMISDILRSNGMLIDIIRCWAGESNGYCCQAWRRVWSSGPTWWKERANFF